MSTAVGQASWELEQLHISVCAAELVTIGSMEGEASVNAEAFLGDFCVQELGGRYTRLVRGIGTSRKGPWQSRWKPTIREWAVLAEIAQCGLQDLLACRPIPPGLGKHAWFFDSSRVGINSSVKSPKNDPRRVREVLRGALRASEPMSVEQVMADLLGAKGNYAYKLAPELAKAVAKRFAQHRALRREQGIDQLKNDIVRVIKEMNADGGLVSLGTVAERLGRNKRQATFRTAYDHVVRN